MSENTGFETMRDLVRALQQAEYGLRTGILSTDDVEKACERARDLYERLVVVRHKAREERTHTAEKRAKKAAAETAAALKAQEAVQRIEEAASTVQVAQPEMAVAPQESLEEAIANTAKEVVPTPVAKEEPTPEAAVAPVTAVIKAPTAPTPASLEPNARVTVEPEAPSAQAPTVLEAPKPLKVEIATATASAPLAVPAEPKAHAQPPVALGKSEVQPIEAETEVPKPEVTALPVAEKPKQTSTGPKTASDYLKEVGVEELKDSAATPGPAPELAALRAQQIVTRSVPAPPVTATVAEKLEKAHITDLAKSVSVSHRFWFTTELFNGDKAAYEGGMARLNGVSDLAAARKLLETEILPKLKKPAHEEALNAIGELLQRRFE